MRLPLLFMACVTALCADVDLTAAWITDFDLARLAARKDVTKIVLSETRITDRGLEMLKNMTGVVEFNCYFCDFITEDGIAHLRGWNRLEKLNLRGTRVTSKVFPYLANLTSLRELDLSHTQIEDEGFEHLESLNKLEKLAIGGNRLTVSCLPVLKLLPSLVELDVSGIQRVDSGLWGLALSVENLRRLGGIPQLRRLNLARATLNDRGTDRPGHPDALRKELRDLSPLHALKNLEWVDVTGLPLTEEAAAQLGNLRRDHPPAGTGR
jgi:hypothetical protein